MILLLGQGNRHIFLLAEFLILTGLSSLSTTLETTCAQQAGILRGIVATMLTRATSVCFLILALAYLKLLKLSYHGLWVAAG